MRRYLQIKLVETACVDYLLELTLPAQQLGQVLVLFSTLSLKTSIEQLVLRYVQQPWTQEVMAVLQVLFGHLNHLNMFQECLVLRKTNTGKSCELQVCNSFQSASTKLLSMHHQYLTCAGFGYAVVCWVWSEWPLAAYTV